MSEPQDDDRIAERRDYLRHRDQDLTASPPPPSRTQDRYVYRPRGWVTFTTFAMFFAGLGIVIYETGTTDRPGTLVIGLLMMGISSGAFGSEIVKGMLFK